MELPEVNIYGEKKLPIKQIIFVLIALVIVGEIAWVGWSIYSAVSSQTSVGTDARSASGLTENLATLTLKTNKTTFSIGEKIPIDILVSSVRNTDGTDIVIYYDPKLLSVDTVDDTASVTSGLIYSDYPINRTDSQNNRVEFSGITVSQDGVRPNGVLGTVTFTAKASGKAKIWFDFTPGSTTDSNVVESKTAKDILSKVENLEINIK